MQNAARVDVVFTHLPPSVQPTHIAVSRRGPTVPLMRKSRRPRTIKPPSWLRSDDASDEEWQDRLAFALAVATLPEEWSVFLHPSLAPPYPRRGPFPRP